MSKASDFLFEIGVEELPAAAAASALDQLLPLTLEAFRSRRVPLGDDSVRALVSPRRIAILVDRLPETQEDEESIERGPAASAAYDENGEPTRAAQGFAKAKDIAVSDLEVRDHEGREFVFAVRRRRGGPVADLLPDICSGILKGIFFPKTMRWDDSGLSFSRPVRWLVAKLGDETLEFEAFGLRSSATSRGHRFLSAGEVEIESASTYVGTLAAASVTVDQGQRRKIITEGLESLAAARGARYSDPGGKLDEVLYLVEHPTVLEGEFAEEHLRLPDRVLITAMQSHQRYFPIIGEDGNLVNGFLYVMNADPAFAEVITEGNERILEGRIEDAEFSFDKDLETGIEAMSERLADVVFHRRLGSLAHKTARLEGLVEMLAHRLGLPGEELKTAAAAARLAKADLVSVMVQEFPDLEGYIGSVYARMEGFPGDVCTAVADHYLPTSAGGALPQTLPGALLSIADRVDNIVGAWSVDELPTGSRDPYGLRRAAVGIAAIAEQFQLDFNLAGLFSAAHQLYIDQKADVDRSASLIDDMLEFAYGRMQGRQVEQGMPVEVFEAARASGINSPLRLTRLARALDDFRGGAEFEDLHTAYFRCSKIAAKSGEEISGEVDESLFENETEGELQEALDGLAPRLDELISESEYERALSETAALRGVVDRFFDEVLVMAEDVAVRNNRLLLVSRAAGMMLRLGDPIQVAAAAEK